MRLGRHAAPGKSDNKFLRLRQSRESCERRVLLSGSAREAWLERLFVPECRPPISCIHMLPPTAHYYYIVRSMLSSAPTIVF